jgi:hypothetical protein
LSGNLSSADVKEDFTPIKVWSLLQFFTLAGRKTTLIKENLIPIPDLKYVVLTLVSDERYYVREFHGYTIDQLYFYRRTLDFSGEDMAIENLRRYVNDERVWLLYTPTMIESTSDMLKRVFKTNVNGEGALSYKMFIKILEAALKLDDYRDYGKNFSDFKTVCKIMEDHTNELWKQVSQTKKIKL